MRARVDSLLDVVNGRVVVHAAIVPATISCLRQIGEVPIVGISPLPPMSFGGFIV